MKLVEKIKNKAMQSKGLSKLAVNATLLSSSFMLAVPQVFADKELTEGEQVINGILEIVGLITNVLGIIFVIVGFVKLVISNAQEDAPGQQKAAMFIATGLALILLKPVMSLIPFGDWLLNAGA